MAASMHMVKDTPTRPHHCDTTRCRSPNLEKHRFRMITTGIGSRDESTNSYNYATWTGWREGYAAHHQQQCADLCKHRHKDTHESV